MITIPPQVEVPFSWTSDKQEKSIQLSLEDTLYSYPFTFEQIDEFSVKLLRNLSKSTNSKELTKTVRVKVSLDGAQIKISFCVETHEFPSYRIENATDSRLR